MVPVFETSQAGAGGGVVRGKIGGERGAFRVTGAGGWGVGCHGGWRGGVGSDF